jgi:hypothetical protein
LNIASWWSADPRLVETQGSSLIVWKRGDPTAPQAVTTSAAATPNSAIVAPLWQHPSLLVKQSKRGILT